VEMQVRMPRDELLPRAAGMALTKVWLAKVVTTIFPAATVLMLVAFDGFTLALCYRSAIARRRAISGLKSDAQIWVGASLGMRVAAEGP
jgi:hypothetical protein